MHQFLSEYYPSNLTEIGLVQCGIGEAGGNALVDWVLHALKIHWLCVERNSFSDETKGKLIELAKGWATRGCVDFWSSTVGIMK